MTSLLVLAGMACVGFGFVMLTEATTGVGIIAIGCFIGIWARIVQAAIQHEATQKAREEAREKGNGE